MVSVLWNSWTAKCKKCKMALSHLPALLPLLLTLCSGSYAQLWISLCPLSPKPQLRCQSLKNDPITLTQAQPVFCNPFGGLNDPFIGVVYQISCIWIFTLGLIRVAKLQFWISNKNNLMIEGLPSMRTCMEWLQLRKVKGHCSNIAPSALHRMITHI